MNLSACGALNTTCDCKTSNSLNECLWEPLTPFGVGLVVIVGFIYLIVFVIACVWNTFVIAIFIKDRHLLQEPSSLFLFTLAVVDAAEAVLSIPFYVTALIGGGWIIGNTDATRERTCIALAFIFSMFLFTTVHLIAVISFDRFLYIVYPLKYAKWMSPPRALCVVGLVFCVPLVLASLPFFGFGELGYSPYIGVCTIRWEGEREYVATIAVEALLPILGTIIFTLWTYIHARRFLTRRHIRHVSYGIPKESVHNAGVQNQKINRTLTHTFLLLLISQAVCFAPGIVTALVGFFVGYGNIPTPIYVIDFLIIVSSVAINPIIQSASRTKVRKYLANIFNKLRYRLQNGHPQSFPLEITESSEPQDTRMTESSALQDTRITSSENVNDAQVDDQGVMTHKFQNIRYEIDPIRGTLV